MSKREIPNYTNYDIREIIIKDCIPIWQKATIRDALPEEYDQGRVEQGKKAREKQLEEGNRQSTEFADPNQKGDNQPTGTGAKSGSVGPVEDESEDLGQRR